MRVVLVTANPDPRDGALFIELCRRFGGLRILAPSHAAIAEWPRDVPIYGIPTIGSNWTRQWMKGVTRAIEELDPDLIHVHNEPWAFTTQRLMRTGRPVVIHGAESVLNEAPMVYRVRRFGLRNTLKSAAGYVNWGVTGLRAAERAGLPPSTPRAVISASPPDPRVFSRAGPRQPDGLLRLLFVGRLISLKGVDDLIRAVPRTLAPDRIRLTIIGTGPDEGRLKALAHRFNVSARFVGELTATEVHQELVASDVLVAPSRDTTLGIEQWGRVVVEAMLTGRAPLVSDSGELPYLVGSPEWVFRQDDPVSLAKALDVLIAKPSVVPCRALEAYERSQQFRPDILAGKLLGFWDEVQAAMGCAQ